MPGAFAEGRGEGCQTDDDRHGKFTRQTDPLSPTPLPRGERGVNRLLRLQRSFICLLLCALGVGAPAMADSASPPASQTVTEDPLERQTFDIAKDLRCTVCQNQPVSESNSDLAHDMRAIIREQLQAGKSRDEIVGYFVARYGDYVLLKPPFHERGFFLWLGPPLLLIVVGGFAWYFIRRRAAMPAAPPPALSPQDLARIDAARREN